LGENAYKIELPVNMYISGTFNVRDLNSYVEDEHECNEDLGANPLQRRNFDVKQATRFNLIIHIKTMVQIAQMMTFENRAQGPLKSLLT